MARGEIGRIEKKLKKKEEEEEEEEEEEGFFRLFGRERKVERFLLGLRHFLS